MILISHRPLILLQQHQAEAESAGFRGHHREVS